MGAVYLGIDCWTGQKAAVKIIKERNNWKREKQVLEKMEGCEGIPMLLESGKEKGKWVLVVEYIHGKSIRQWILHRGTPGEKQLIAWMREVCEIVKALHERGIIHMDLKPENVMITEKGKIFLIDFGISANAGEIIEAYGTREYAAPEQQRKGEIADVRMDIYSLGKMMEFCSGKNCSNRVTKICKQCTQKEVKDRYNSVNELAREIKKQFIWMRLQKTGKLAAIVVAVSFSFRNAAKDLYWSFIMQDRIESGTGDVHKPSCSLKNDDAFFQMMGRNYLFGDNERKADYDLANQYFSGVKKPNEKTSAYIRIIRGLQQKEPVDGMQMRKDLLLCEEDAKSINSMCFFMKQYILWADQMPDRENSWQKAEDFLHKIEITNKDLKEKRSWQQERLEILEHQAELGDDKKFLEETSRPLTESMNCLEAWRLYQRKISYFDRMHRELSKYYEEFLKKYPNTADCYLEYGIYLCRERRWREAESVYRRGVEKTNFTGVQAETLRRKLGL